MTLQKLKGNEVFVYNFNQKLSGTPEQILSAEVSIFIADVYREVFQFVEKKKLTGEEAYKVLAPYMGYILKEIKQMKHVPRVKKALCRKTLMYLLYLLQREIKPETIRLVEDILLSLSLQRQKTKVVLKPLNVFEDLGLRFRPEKFIESYYLKYIKPHSKEDMTPLLLKDYKQNIRDAVKTLKAPTEPKGKRLNIDLKTVNKMIKRKKK